LRPVRGAIDSKQGVNVSSHRRFWALLAVAGLLSAAAPAASAADPQAAVTVTGNGGFHL
jgi:hypothetical protein